MVRNPLRSRPRRSPRLVRKHPILIVGSRTFAARLALAFSPRHEFEITHVSSISTDLILGGLVPELAILDGDDLRDDIFILLDALSRFRAEIPVVLISSHPEFFRVAGAMEVVSSAQAMAFLSRRRRQLRNQDPRGDGTRSHVPLGITGDHVAMGAHIAFVWRTDADLRRLFHFWISSEPTAQMVLSAPPRLLDYLCSVLTKCGMNSRALIASSKLILVEGEQLTNTVVKKIVGIVSRSARRGAWPVRIISFCAGHKGGRQSKQQEEKLDQELAHLPAVLVCPYRIGDFRADDFLADALATHRHVVVGDCLFKNSFYLP